jgi:N-acetylmuramoyl-L-alanine amidase
VLEVALRIRNYLTRLGAKVTLLREDCQPINPKTFIDYWALAAAEEMPPTELSLRAHFSHALAVRNRAIHLAIVRGEIAERARLVNEVIQPDALISLHINAAAWPDGDTEQLVDSDHAHVLIFGCLSEAELASPQQQLRLARKLRNGSGPVEARLGAALGSTLVQATGLPASNYLGRNAIRILPEVPSLWARNLMLLRLVDCPTVLMEPYITNSHSSYARIQKALSAREYHEPLPTDDILVEYADAVVAGVLRAYEQD